MSASGLSPKQLMAAEALGGGSTISKAAAFAGVAESAIYRWKKHRAFQEAVDSVLAQRLEHYRGLRLRITGQALVRYLKILADDSLPASIHLRAARPFLPDALDIDRIHEADLSEADKAFFDRFSGFAKYEN